MKIILTVMKGELAGKAYELDKKAVIGRSPKVQIVLEDELVSRKHAEITVKDNAVFIKDMKSAGGTFVNSQTLTEKSPLKSRDKIRIGNTIFEIKILKPKKKSKKEEKATVAAQKFGRTLSDIARTDTEQVDTAKVVETLKQDEVTIPKKKPKKAEKSDVYSSKRSQKAQKQAIEVVTKYKGIKQTKKKVSLKDRLGFLSMSYDEMAWWMKLAFAAGIVIIALLLGQLGFSIFDSDPEETIEDTELVQFIPDIDQRIAWAPGTGYESGYPHCPRYPHEVISTYTKCFITDFKEGKIVTIGDIETRDSGQMIVFPGAIISNAYQGAESIRLKDYNGDFCIIPYGAILEVTGYGIFKLLDDDADTVQDKLAEMQEKLAKYENSETPDDENAE